MVTEGVLTRLLHQDPSLEAYGIVLFDEFHERSLQADLGLALCLEAQRLFRPDLRLLVMSATLNCGPVAELLGRAPLITCEGRMFPVETRYLDQPLTGRLDVAVSQLIRQSLAKDRGSLLVFLPGMADIRRVERILVDSHLDRSIQIAPLHGDLPQSRQDVAIRPTAPGMRKVVLATSIAETSLTIDGIRVVIDAGRLRIPRYDLRSGLTRLETIRVTHDSSEQRRGRAGRLEPGLCYRLWTEKEQAMLAPRRPPEILEADSLRLCSILRSGAQVIRRNCLGSLHPLPGQSLRPKSYCSNLEPSLPMAPHGTWTADGRIASPSPSGPYVDRIRTAWTHGGGLYGGGAC